MIEQFAARLAAVKTAISLIKTDTRPPWKFDDCVDLIEDEEGYIIAEHFAGDEMGKYIAAAASPDFLSELIRRYEELEAESKWIPVSQEFPPLDADNCCMDEEDYGRYSNPVMIFEEDEAIVTTAVYDAKLDEWSDARNGGQFFGVTHWRKCPAPPVVEEDAPKEKK